MEPIFLLVTGDGKMAGMLTGTVTFLFTDIEANTKLAREHRGMLETI
jgi:hypothetical protein